MNQEDMEEGKHYWLNDNGQVSEMKHYAYKRDNHESKRAYVWRVMMTEFEKEERSRREVFRFIDPDSGIDYKGLAAQLSGLVAQGFALKRKCTVRKCMVYTAQYLPADHRWNKVDALATSRKKRTAKKVEEKETKPTPRFSTTEAIAQTSTLGAILELLGVDRDDLTGVVEDLLYDTSFADLKRLLPELIKVVLRYVGGE